MNGHETSPNKHIGGECLFGSSLWLEVPQEGSAKWEQHAQVNNNKPPSDPVGHCETRSCAHTWRVERKLLGERFPGPVGWMARSPWQRDHFISGSEQMVGVQQATYVPMSRGHYYRWRVGRRQALKHNLTFPPHLTLHCYISQREISPKRWIAAQNLFKGKLLTFLHTLYLTRL